jgi:DNA repair exonuclease SbcCD ATPase subunit
MEIRLKSLELEGFRSFKKRTRFDFPTDDAIIMVAGKWKGSSITSGVGKTTIMEAWAFLFDINTSSVASLTNWDSKKIFVQGTIQAGGDEIVITRNPKLSLSINGVAYEGLTLGAREKLQGILGVNTDMLKAITYRKQRVHGKLVKSTDGEIKEFLTQPLGLNEIETASDEFNRTANKITEELALIKRDVTNFESNLQMNLVTEAEQTEYQNRLLVAQAGLPAAEKNILTANESVSSSQSALAAANATLAEAQAKVVALSANTVSQTLLADSATVKGELSKINSEITKINTLSSNIQSKRTQNLSLKETYLRIQKEIEHLTAGTCPTCSREWDQVNVIRASKEKALEETEIQLRTNVEYIRNSEPILLELPGHQSRMLELNQKLAEINQKLGEANAPAAMAQQNVQTAIQGVNAANAGVRNAQASVTAAQYSLFNAQKGVESAQQVLNGLEQKRKNYDTILGRLNQAKEALAAKELDVEVNVMSSRLLGNTGFLGSIFDEILSDIEIRSNEMLQDFPNANMFTIQINSTKQVKSKGTTKKEISVTISKNGTDVTMDDISGGQQAAVELCTDLAAAEAIRARSGCALKWVFLDEVMDGLGPTEKESVVNMIKKRIKGLVLMIEHASEIKDSFDQMINLEYDGKESYVAAG